MDMVKQNCPFSNWKIYHFCKIMLITKNKWLKEKLIGVINLNVLENIMILS